MDSLETTTSPSSKCTAEYVLGSWAVSYACEKHSKMILDLNVPNDNPNIQPKQFVMLSSGSPNWTVQSFPLEEHSDGSCSVRSHFNKKAKGGGGDHANARTFQAVRDQCWNTFGQLLAPFCREHFPSLPIASLHQSLDPSPSRI